MISAVPFVPALFVLTLDTFFLTLGVCVFREFELDPYIVELTLRLTSIQSKHSIQFGLGCVARAEKSWLEFCPLSVSFQQGLGMVKTWFNDGTYNLEKLKRLDEQIAKEVDLAAHTWANVLEEKGSIARDDISFITPYKAHFAISAIGHLILTIDNFDDTPIATLCAFAAGYALGAKLGQATEKAWQLDQLHKFESMI